MSNKTQIRIIKQQHGQLIGDYEKQLQVHLDDINKSSEGAAMCFPTSDANGMLTTMIQWTLWEKREEFEWEKEEEAK
jgi:hypothetical protein